MCLFSWARLPLYSSPFAHPHHSTLPPPSHRCHLQLPQQKCLPVCLNVSLWSGTSPLAPGGPHTHTHTPFISYDRFSLDNPDKTSETDANLRRWEICGHAITQRRGDECTAKDGAHVAGHDFLLFHAAVVLQGENHWILGCLRKSRQPPPKQTHISVLLDVEWRHAGYQQMLNIPWRHAHWWLWSHL